MNDDTDDAPLAYLSGHIGENYADAFGACRELLSTMFELDAPRPEDRAGYWTAFEIYDFGPMQMVASKAPASVLTRGAQTIARSGTDHFHVHFYRKNGFVITLDGARVPIAAGEVCLIDLSRPVDIRTDGVDSLSAILARNLILPLIDDPADAHGLVLRLGGETNIAIRSHLEDMWLEAPGLTRRQGREFARSTAALLAVVIGANRQSLSETRAEMRRSQFKAMCRLIDDQIGDRALGSAHLIDQFHVTRPTLYRMFEPHGGVAKYILGRRLAGVLRDLSDPALADEKIAVLLRRWGFANHTAAGRAFRAAYGVSPSEARSQVLKSRQAGRAAGEHAYKVTNELPAIVKKFAG